MYDSLAALLLIATLVPPIGAEKTFKSIQSRPLETCSHMNSRHGLAGYESGGPYSLEHFRLTKGRTDLREFLWKHWHSKTKGIAEVRAGTVDRPVKPFGRGRPWLRWTRALCKFNRGKDIAQKCGDGARVCTDYIKLPKSLHTSPPMAEDTPFGCRWVRKEAFQAALDTLHESAK